MATNTATTWMLVVVLVAAGASTAAVGGVAATGSDAGAPAAAQGCTFPVEVVDATGTTVTIDGEPERVVTTAPSAAQTMVEIGAWEKVVGVSRHASYLEGADEREVVSAEGDAFVDVETVVALEPDLVLAPNVLPDEEVENLRDAGLTVYAFEEAESVDDVADQTALAGELVGSCDGAAETVDWMEAELATVREAVEGQERPRVLYVYAPEFGPYTAGADTFIGHMIELAGAENVAAEAGIEGHQTVSDEVVAEQDPEWIVVNDFDGAPPGRAAYNETTAVREGNVVVVDSNYINQAAPRVVLAIRAMARAFHPEAYAEAAATPSPTPTTDPGTEATPTPIDDGVPGFGVSVALVALVATLLALRRLP